MDFKAEPKATGVTASQVPLDAETASENIAPEKKGTPSDQRDMFRMGKLQEMRVCHYQTLHNSARRKGWD